MWEWKFLKLFKSKKFGFEFNNYADVDKSIKRLNHKQVYDQEYDLIIMRGVIEHIPKFNNLIKKLSKCVKQDGLFFITATPNSNNLTFFYLIKILIKIIQVIYIILIMLI